MAHLRTLLVLFLAAAGTAQAHPGHGDAAPVHWHAFDAWGWALALAVGAGLWWWSRRR